MIKKIMVGLLVDGVLEKGCYIVLPHWDHQLREILLQAWQASRVEMRGIILQLEMILGTYLILIIIFSRGARGVDFLAKNLGALDNLEENS